MKQLWIVVIGVALVLAGCRSEETATPAPAITAAASGAAAPAGTPDPERLAAPQDREALLAAVPALAKREERFAAALASDQPILTLTSGLDDDQQRAQALAVADAQLQSFVRDRTTGQPVRSEVMMVRPVLPTDLTEATTALCPQGACYRVEVYNYAANATVVALVHLDRGAVVDIAFYPETQPELPPWRPRTRTRATSSASSAATGRAITWSLTKGSLAMARAATTPSST